jgi:hypothetical protein
MCASKGWCTNTGWKASRTTIFLNCQWGAIAGKTFKCALIWANFLSRQLFADAEAPNCGKRVEQGFAAES